MQERLAVVQERLAVVQEAGGGRARASGYDDSRRGKRPRVERTRPFRDKASRRKWRGQRLLGNRASHRPHAHRQWMECARAFGEGTRAFGEGAHAFGEGAHASGERARAVAGSASACTRMRMRLCGLRGDACKTHACLWGRRACLLVGRRGVQRMHTCPRRMHRCLGRLCGGLRSLRASLRVLRAGPCGRRARLARRLVSIRERPVFLAWNRERRQVRGGRHLGGRARMRKRRASRRSSGSLLTSRSRGLFTRSVRAFGSGARYRSPCRGV